MHCPLHDLLLSNEIITKSQIQKDIEAHSKQNEWKN